MVLNHSVVLINENCRTEEYPKYGETLPVMEMETEQFDRVNYMQTISNTCTCKEREEEVTVE